MDAGRHCPGVGRVSPAIHSKLMNVVGGLSESRAVKAGKKAYDLMAAGYFEDMLQVIAGAYATPGNH